MNSKKLDFRDEKNRLTRHSELDSESKPGKRIFYRTTMKAYVYVLTNHTRTTFYTGVTNNLARRLEEHRTGQGSKFVQKYNVHELVYYEVFESIKDAIAREKQLKNWHRDWKIELIKSLNPDMNDLSEEIPW